VACLLFKPTVQNHTIITQDTATSCADDDNDDDDYRDQRKQN